MIHYLNQSGFCSRTLKKISKTITYGMALAFVILSLCLGLSFLVDLGHWIRRW